MIYIDPSELRETSNLKHYITDVVYRPLPGLEARTGADLMISPDGLLRPKNDALLRYHIEQGAKLEQYKFDHDLPQSIADGRFNEALSRMLATGAQSWQCLLTPVGSFGYDQTGGMVTINGQLSYGDTPMKWQNMQAALTFWVERGGALSFPLPSGELIAEHLKIHQDHINRFRSGEASKIIWPNQPAFYDEIDKDQPIARQWQAAQELKPVKDLRILLCAIPGVGPEKATAIFEYMKLNGIPEHFGGFLNVLQNDVEEPDLLKVHGIGKGTLRSIRSFLWETREERERSKS